MDLRTCRVPEYGARGAQRERDCARVIATTVVYNGIHIVAAVVAKNETESFHFVNAGTGPRLGSARFLAIGKDYKAASGKPNMVGVVRPCEKGRAVLNGLVDGRWLVH
jgi:hypothetical protein